MFKRIAILLPVLVAGCAQPKIEFASSSAVTVRYDPGTTTLGEVQEVAQQRCAAYGKDAVPHQTSDSQWGFRTEAFVCQVRQ